MHYSKAPVLALSLLLVACDNSNPVAETTVDDTTAPTVISTAPADAATGVATSSTVQATFSEDMLTTSIDNTSVTLAGASNVTGTVDFDALTNIVTFTPDSSLRMLTNYTATLSAAITDLVGNPLNNGADSSWSFTTKNGTWGTADLIESNTGSASTPEIAIDANGNALAVWRQYDGTYENIWANRYVVGTGWGTANLIESNTGHAATPQVAVDSNGNALAVWQQSNNIWANRYDVITGWGTAELIETGIDSAKLPQVAMDADGNALAVWSQVSGGFTDNIWANRYDASTGWSAAELIEAGTESAQLPKVAMDANGNAFAVWHQNDSTRNNIWANRYDAATGWGSAELIESNDVSYAVRAQIAVDVSGNAFAVWVHNDGFRNNIWANRYDASTGWGSAELIETNNDGSADEARIAMDTSGNAFALWVQYDSSPLQNIWANRYDATTGWGTAELIETNDVGGAVRAEIAVDASGNALAVWEHYDGSRADIWANRYVAGSGWGAAGLIETNDAGSAFTAQIAINANGNALAVWVQNDGVESSINATRFE